MQPDDRLRISELRPEDRAAWHEFTQTHQGATVFHGLAWMDSVRSAFGHRPCCLMARQGDRVRGVLPLFEVRSLLAGRMVVSVPYATYGGSLADDSAVECSLLDEARRRTLAAGAAALELRTIKAADAGQSIRRSHARFVRELPSAVDDLSAWLPRKARAAARRASERYGLQVETGAHLISEVWKLYARSMRRLGSPNYPRNFFEQIVQRHEPGSVVLQLVRHRGGAAASLLSLVHRGIMMPYFVGMDERRDLYGISHFLYVNLMRQAIAMGCHTFDFGRTRFDNPGPFEFKRHFGFEPQALEYQVFTVPGATAPDLAPSSPRWAAGRRLWRRLPLTMTRPLGAWLARAIPG